MPRGKGQEATAFESSKHLGFEVPIVHRGRFSDTLQIDTMLLKAAASLPMAYMDLD